MTAMREQISAYVDANAGRLVEELQRFLRQPSISTVTRAWRNVWTCSGKSWRALD